MTRLWTITANTFIQTVRRPIFTILLLVTYLVLVLEMQLAGNSQGYRGVSPDDNQLLVTLGLSTLMLSGLALAAFSAAAALTREIEQRTVMTVVTKPVARAAVLTGKFLGVLGAVSIGLYLAMLVYLMTVRHGVLTRGADPLDYPVIFMGVGAFVLALLVAGFGNYFFGWSFHTAQTLLSLLLFSVAMVFICLFEKHWRPVPFGSSFDPQLILVLVLLWMATAVLTALTVALSARLGQAASLGAVAVLYLLSLLSAAVFAARADDNVVASGLYHLIPNASYFLAVDQLMLKQPITGQYMLLAGLYSAAFIVAALLVGIALFETREVDAAETAPLAPTLVNLYAWGLRSAALIIGVLAVWNLGRRDHWQRDGQFAPGLPALGLLGLLALAALGWLWAGLLGRGVRWALHLVVLAAAAQVLLVLYALIFHPDRFDALRWQFILILSAAHVACVLVMRLRRATKAHFAIARRRPRSAEPVARASRP